jgi:hypothetical protein
MNLREIRGEYEDGSHYARFDAGSVGISKEEVG